MHRYRLHYFPESGNSYKLALMLTLCGQQFEKVWTDFGGGVTRTAEWRASVNEMGEIPVLEDDGERLTQTAPILLRLAERYGKFQGDGEAERFEVLRWLFWDNHRLTATMATYRFQRTYMKAPDPQVLAFLRGRLDDYLRILQGHLETRAFVTGDRPTVADLSMIGYLYSRRTKAVTISPQPIQPSGPGSTASLHCRDGSHRTTCCPASACNVTRKWPIIRLHHDSRWM